MKRAHRFGAVALIVALVFIGGITLQAIPSQAIQSKATPFLCLPCGDAGAADFILNILLFIPFGFSLGLLGVAGGAAIAVSATLTAGIEALQVAVVPGRDAALADVVANTLGGGLGWLAMTYGWRILETSRARSRRWLVLSLVSVGTVAGVTIPLVRPSLPENVWYGQWAIDSPEPGWFGGEVLSVELGDRPLPHWRVFVTKMRRLELERGPMRLTAKVISGDPTPEPVRILSVAGDRSKFLVLGQQGNDLTLDVRLRASGLRLHSPRFRAHGLLPDVAGDTVIVEGVLNRGVAYLSVEGTEGRKHSQVRLSALDGWTFFVPIPLSGAPLPFVLTLGWIGVLFLPVGWFGSGQSGRRFALSLVALLAVITIGSLLGQVPPPSVANWGAAVGWAFLGRAMGAWTSSKTKADSMMA